MYTILIFLGQPLDVGNKTT